MTSLLLARHFLDDARAPLRERTADAVACRRGRHPGARLAGQRARAGQRDGARRCSSPTPSRSDPTTSGSAPPSGAARSPRGPSGEVRIDFPDSGLSLEAVERALLVAALEKSGGNQSAAARLLGVSRDTLRYRMEKFGLEQ